MPLAVGPEEFVDEFDELEDEVGLCADELLFGLLEDRLAEVGLEG